MKRFILRTMTKPILPEFEVCEQLADGTADTVAQFVQKRDAEEYMAWKNKRISQRRLFKQMKPLANHQKLA